MGCAVSFQSQTATRATAAHGVKARLRWQRVRQELAAAIGGAGTGLLQDGTSDESCHCYNGHQKQADRKDT
jgi:hypothetical protein